jgi:hypothetical protein
LLEATGKWCHAQLQCYTFGCPFFADYRLARFDSYSPELVLNFELFVMASFFVEYNLLARPFSDISNNTME